MYSSDGDSIGAYQVYLGVICYWGDVELVGSWAGVVSLFFRSEDEGTENDMCTVQ